MKKIKELNLVDNIQKRNATLLFLLLIMALVVLPTNAFASNSVEEFTRPLQGFIDLLSGQWARAIATFGVFASGISLIVFRKSIDEFLQGTLIVVCAICLVVAAGPLVSKLFNFSGALIA